MTPSPKHRSKGKGKGKQKTDSPDTVIAQRAPRTAALPDPARHSHGLSWHSTTRDSVVDNLLFSLDSFSRNDQDGWSRSPNNEREQYLASLVSNFSSSTAAGRRRGHTQSSSTSELDRQNMESPQSKYSTGSKGRRSGSSTNYRSFRTVKPGEKVLLGSMPRSSSETQKQHTANGSLAGRSSEGGSVDYGYTSMPETNRLAWGGKSVSMNDIYAESADGPSVLERGRPVPSVHSKYEANGEADAAPEPRIAAGPRKMLDPASAGPVYVNAKSKPSALRKITTQTDLRSQAALGPAPSIPLDIRNQAADFVRTSSMRGTLAPPSAPHSNAPTSGTASRSRGISPTARDRPGFFKRVFSGVSSRAATPAERPGSKQASYDAPPRSTSQASEGTHSQNDNKDTKQADNMPVSLPATLNKKPSSFFRRRKKSTSEAISPPPLPPPVSISNATSRGTTASQPSPSISSLRKIMDPYLSAQQATQPSGAPQASKSGDDPRPETADSRQEDSEDPDIFHTGYTPPADASMKAWHPSRSDSLRPSLDQESKMKVRKRRGDALANPDTQDLGGSTTLPDPIRQNSTNTIRDHNIDPPKVSPLSDVHPELHRSTTPGSRPSTGEGIIHSREVSPVEPTQDMRDFSAGTNVSLSMDEDWVVAKPSGRERPPSSKKSERLRLQPTASEERLNSTRRSTSPVEGSSCWQSASLQRELPVRSSSALGVPAEVRAASPLQLPALPVQGTLSRKSSEPTIFQVPPEIVDEGAEYRERARKIFQGDEEDVSKPDAAAWMGERNTLSTRTLEAYMQLFDFNGLNVLASLRLLCSKLMLKGETQQFDRIITALSARWCESNPNHGFKAQDVVHTIVYSLILLNTDLHLADIGEKMSRSAYVKNTLPTIKRVVADAAPNAFDETLKPTPSGLRPSLPWGDSNSSVPTAGAASPKVLIPSPLERRGSNAGDGSLSATKRLSMRPAVNRTDSDNATADTPSSGAMNALVNHPWTGSMRGWENELEVILKAFFTSIKAEPLHLHGAVIGDLPTGNRNLSVVDLTSNLKRSGSVISRAPSENMSYRSKQDFRSYAMRFPGSRSRSRPKLYPASTVASSRTSFDDGSGFWSPAQSSRSYSKTLTSASVSSFNHFSPVDTFKHSIGFANALSQSMIREESIPGDENFSVPGGLLDDENLSLEGAPWAKEGMVKHKHHLEMLDKKAKDRNWNECFAVVSKGKLTLFAFNTSTKTQSFGRKGHFGRSGKAASVTSARVGGGDWMENAEQLDVFVLRQTIATTLPPPGYSKTRPHVWALSLPSGAVHLFQVGTPEIAEEFMTTANYWSARLSKEPLAGGVSNIEYGWSDNVINTALLERPDDSKYPPASMQNRAGRGHLYNASLDERPSIQSSLRTSFDTGFGGVKAKLPGDKVFIMDWQPPSQSMMASQLMEVDQLKQLTAYVQGQEEELEKHNELKHAIELAVSASVSN